MSSVFEYESCKILIYNIFHLLWDSLIDFHPNPASLPYASSERGGGEPQLKLL